MGLSLRRCLVRLRSRSCSPGKQLNMKTDTFKAGLDMASNKKFLLPGINRRMSTQQPVPLITDISWHVATSEDEMFHPYVNPYVQYPAHSSRLSHNPTNLTLLSAADIFTPLRRVLISYSHRRTSNKAVSSHFFYKNKLCVHLSYPHACHASRPTH
jgi:hypothetical protein